MHFYHHTLYHAMKSKLLCCECYLPVIVILGDFHTSNIKFPKCESGFTAVVQHFSPSSIYSCSYEGGSLILCACGGRGGEWENSAQFISYTYTCAKMKGAEWLLGSKV